MLIEIPEEGGITRVMAVFQDPTGVGNLGTIRSTREYFVFMAMGLDAMLAHCGASTTANDTLSQTGYATLDAMSHGNSIGAIRTARQTLAREHSMYTSTDQIQEYLVTLISAPPMRTALFLPTPLPRTAPRSAAPALRTSM